MPSIDEVKLKGGKKKNGHKATCTCHICENMKNKAKRGGYSMDAEKKAEYIGGYKKKNGHRQACKCPICRNMNNKGKSKSKKMRGGTDVVNEDFKSNDDDTASNQMGGKRRRRRTRRRRH